MKRSIRTLSALAMISALVMVNTIPVSAWAPSSGGSSIDDDYVSPYSGGSSIDDDYVSPYSAGSSIEDNNQALPQVTVPVDQLLPALTAVTPEQSADSAASAAAIAALSGVTSPTPASGSFYTTVAKDNLSKIAEKAYGDPNRWREIYEANKAQIKNPNKIFCNQILLIP